MNRNSLKFRLPFFIVVFAISCVSITGLLLQYIVSKNIEANAMNKNLVISKMISNQIALYLEDAKSTVATAANFSSQSPYDMPKIKQEIFRIYDNFNYFDLIFYMNSEARMVFAKPSNEHVKDRIYTDRSYYWDIMDGKKTTISPLLVSSVLKMPHFIIASSVYDNNGQTIGLIGAGLPLENIKRVIEKTQKRFDGKIWITDEKGIMAVHPDINITSNLIELENRKVYKNKTEIDLLSILKSKKETICNYYIDGKKYYGAITFVPEQNWMVVVEQDENSIFSEVIELKKQLKSVIIIVIIIALILGLILARKITNPIEGLVKQVRKLSYELRDPQPINIDLQAKDEIGELSRAFSDMSIKLKENLKELEDAYIRENQLKQYLNNILKSVTSGILVIDKQGMITIFNKEAEHITEFNSEEFIYEHIDKFWDKMKLSLGDIINKVLNEGKIFKDIEVTMQSKSGKEIPISVSASQVLDNDKNAIGVVFLFRDLTKIKTIEEELKREDRIRTLGELSASIIHDIGNPLAGISNLIEILKNNNDRETEKEVLDVLDKEVMDLNNLVINFLEFSRSSTKEKEPTNIKQLVSGIINLLKPEIIDKKINIVKKYEKNPLMVKIDRRAIKQAFINILKNSIQAVCENGKIDIEIKEEKENVLISIRDNGVGIEKEKIEKIFYPFYTTKKEGTGLGLFIAYQLIKENEGQINVKSELGIGTEFLIYLPKDN
jgi:PAS domain S-box-containing protein